MAYKPLNKPFCSYAKESKSVLYYHKSKMMSEHRKMRCTYFGHNSVWLWAKMYITLSIPFGLHFCGFLKKLKTAVAEGPGRTAAYWEGGVLFPFSL